MRRCAFFLFAVPVFLTCLTGCTTVAQDTPTDIVGKSEKRVYEVFGMDCPGCHGGLEKLVKKIAAVQDAEANWQKKQLVVTLQAGVELYNEDVYDAIRRANFTPGKRLN